MTPEHHRDLAHEFPEHPCMIEAVDILRIRKGQHSIRVNDQWRICFVWEDGDATGVEIVDYH